MLDHVRGSLGKMQLCRKKPPGPGGQHIERVLVEEPCSKEGQQHNGLY